MDAGFGFGGKVITAFSGDADEANAVAIQADGQIVVAGSAFNGGILDEGANGDFALARYAAITEPDFALAIDPAPVDVSRGQKIKVKVEVNRTGGFAGDVTITAPDAARLTIVITPESASVSGDVIKFRLKAKGSTPTGRHQIVFIGRDSRGRERSSALTLEIRE